MIEGIVKKIMFTGITKYAKKYGVNELKIEIKVTNENGGGVNYEICNNFQVKEKVNFLDILDKRIDIFGYEGLASPFLKKSLIDIAEEKKLNSNEVCCFIVGFLDKNQKKQIGLAFYKISETNELITLKNVSLSKHLQMLGI